MAHKKGPEKETEDPFNWQEKYLGHSFLLESRHGENIGPNITKNTATHELLNHGDVFDYSKVNYQGSHVKVEIICPVHGSFFQTPASHKHGRFCRHCSFELNAQGSRIGIEEFVQRAIKIHGTK